MLMPAGYLLRSPRTESLMFRCAAVLAIVLAVFAPQVLAQKGDVQRSEVPGEFVISLRSGAKRPDLAAVVGQWKLPADMAVRTSRLMFRWQQPGHRHFTNIIALHLPAGTPSAAVISQLESRPEVEWAAPNYSYTGNVKELVPNDPQYGSQYHHPLMQNDLAWDITLGSSSIIMAVTDDGVDLDHEDLITNIWTNTGEIAGNGVDDDSNGYIDDVNGWDFSTGDNDPNPNTGGDDHGTHVAGICGGRTNNSTGIAGTAGGCTIMPIQWYGVGSWTSTVISDSFAYATDNGAHIINTSYNMNGWVGDATVIAAFQYLYDNGVLHFNSAGNGNELNPARQAFHQTMLVASTTSTDARSSFSNYGTGVDIAAPGSSIFATGIGDTYITKSGTSMAAPNAAGVAALIWSANPAWTRDQVAAQIYGTADNIDAQNPGYEGLLGGGRVNSYRALTETLPAPQATSAPGLPDEGGSGPDPAGSFAVRFDQIMDPVSVNNPGAFSLTYAGPDGTIGTGDDVAIALSWGAYMISSNEASVTVATLGIGNYRLTAHASILENPFGTDLDGDGDGTAGDDWHLNFAIITCAGDLTGDNLINVQDLLAMLTAWGPNPGHAADLNGDDTVDVADLIELLSLWGSCPPTLITNDNCDVPAQVSEGAYDFSNVGATNDGPTPSVCTSNFGSDIWMLYTPGASGTATVTTCDAADYDSYLLAYTGECGSLTQVTCNDDTCGTRAEITFTVTAGSPVLIRLGGWAAAQGSGTVTISVN